MFSELNFQNTLSFAQEMDAKDPLAHFRNEFYIPDFHTNTVRYFTGNSLGLQPKRVEKFLLEELGAWRKFGVEGHFEAKRRSMSRIMTIWTIASLVATSRS